ncbi:PAS domain-containing sensor histidine kinase [Enterovirga aerilata]|uniref:Blue-light-activated histidine kinase n=1 Tax=Enterovirga aerilata TaxID=2730920 RepID=A0A849I1Z4_9HYPH|nr:HWE histidine kinase domain-containing protein [Enterovirga sp. DB1703]NNM73392.1 PAS domain S-box protein [Enterovirga sp. DB1703]
MASSRFPMFVAWGPDLAFLYNEAYAPILGAKHPGAMGRPFREVWPEIWDDLWPLIDTALQGRATWSEDLPLVMHRNGYPEQTFYTFSYSPVRDDSGRVAGMFCACTETTNEVLAERRATFRLALDDALRVITDPVAITEAAAEALGRELRAARVGYAEIVAGGEIVSVARDWVGSPEVPSLAGEARLREAFGPTLTGELRAGRTVVVEDCTSDPRCAGEISAQSWAGTGCRSLLVVPLLRDGELAALLYLHEPAPRRWAQFDVQVAEDVAHRTWDAVVRARAETALRESEARFRHMADSAPALIWMTDERGRVIFANLHFDHVFGRPNSDMHGQGWMDVVEPSRLESFRAVMREAFASRGPFRAEVRVFDRDGKVRWLRCEGVPRRSDSQAFLGYTGCAVDITDVKRAEEHQTLLIHELNHRVKNTLATVQSVATQTLRNAATAEAAREALESRLIALSKAHDVLTRENWDGANLQEIVAQALEPYGEHGAGRLRYRGPEVRLQPRTALAVAMALQELATNAVKYGALSGPEGEIGVEWSVSNAQPARLRLSWVERGGPEVRPPARRGFGSRLIERSLAQELEGEVSMEFRPSGLVCTIDAPLPA